MAEKDTLGEIILKNVRLSYPHLFKPYESDLENDDGEKVAKFRAVFMIPKDDPEGNMKKWKAARKEVEAAKWGAKVPKLKAEKVCMKDGDEEDKAEYEGHYIIAASSGADRPPFVVTNRKDKDKKWIPAKPGQQGAPYGGCYVNAVVRVWAQDHTKWGKRLNCSLESVQFLRDGEAFGAPRANPNDKFTDDDVSDEGQFGDDEDEDEDDVI